MNLLTISKKRAVSKIKNEKCNEALTKTKYFGYKNRVVTSHLDVRKVIVSDEKVEEVTDQRISQILNDKRL